ncbi:MAG: dockerin type I domain-containing protein [Clostridiales Family XIII bacterium]|nr:dockerin type I domain-containing protein [Clostridiales Family XIII bacterium]
MKQSLRNRILTVALSALLVFAGTPVAGSFAADETITVMTGEELDLALRTAPEGSLIVLGADIDAVTSATYGNASYGTGTVKKFTIDGQGHTINGNGISTGAPPEGTTPRNGVSNGTAMRFASSAANTDLTFKNITFRGLASSLNFGGGALGIYHGTVTIQNCTFINNKAVAAGGDGGALNVDGTGGPLTIVNSTFYGNSTGNNGGAISATATGKILNTTIVNNTAGGQGGGLLHNNASNQTTLENSIVVGNKIAPAASQEISSVFDGSYPNVEIIAGIPVRWSITTTEQTAPVGLQLYLPGRDEPVALAANETTVVEFTIDTPGTFEYKSANDFYKGSIEASAQAVTYSDVAAMSNDGGKNLLGVVSEATIAGRGSNPPTVLPVVLNDSTVTGISAEAAAAWLAPAPADNGGLTPTIALLEGAPAKDAASSSAPKTDQRGLLRVGAPDIGAFEYGASTAPANTNAAILSADQESATTQNKIGFTLSAQLKESDKVNAIEMVFAYDKNVFNALPAVVPAGFEVASTFVNVEKGLISVVVGVVNEKTISYDVPIELAKVSLTVKEGQKPDKASLTLTSFKAFSRGASLASEILNAEAETEITILNTEPSDVNQDGSVDTADLSLALYYFGAISTDEDWSTTGAADIDGDGDVDMADITVLVNAVHAAL